ncbi:hypothetical protein AM571_CH02072 [Rhizobium etli 8C-3]|uniref:Uncharacterized protein (DUF1697 family) n=2 Tax=Rhizobium TaxID=379 RepID=A0A4V2VDV9_9HYPH|nr:MULTISPECIES: DUF1697 domain-containing protein [Rhizobium]APO74883.1 hypothetical protein AM571_CH02072 [Rhizobium etli 8C-3]TCU16796.1 uncharacterized protein (DUF1697 family) [Rhizobium azibense]TCU34205.1 uncharacterized protein (DUF1697 family) [Rhizobium azibense]
MNGKTVYVALLHSIALAPGRRVVMSDLRDIAAALGFNNPRTLASTGNIVFEADSAPLGDIEAKFEAAFKTKFAKPVDIIARKGADWLTMANSNPFPDGDGSQVIVRVMRKPLDQSALDRLQPYVEANQHLAVANGDLWIDFGGKPSEWKLLSALTTGRMGVGTLRNWNTVRGLAEMIG